ncbi:MAG: extensin family protein [Xanthobacteraceae bacterium]|nr:extensin family protein [Xanthobacteraceae bacterium]
MARGVAWYLVAPLVLLGLVGCRFFQYEERDPWRTQAEEQCLAERLVQPSAYLEEGSAIDGPGICGMIHPFKVAAMSAGNVAIEPQANLACPLITNLEGWFNETVQPAAAAWFGEPVIEIRQLSSYSCRSMNGQRGASISEHAFGNALDVATFRLASGREVKVKDGWNGRPEEKGFLRHVHAAACERFSTVLAPGADAFHYDHIHVDLARRASGHTVCKPTPVELPLPPMSQGVPVARGPYVIPSSNVATRPPAPPLVGPMVIAREPIRPAGAPMMLGPEAPRSGAPTPVEARVLQSLGTPGAIERQPADRPPVPVMNRPVPPANIPTARRSPDALVTGSTGEIKSPGKAGSDLMSPDPIAQRKEIPSGTASVFDLPRAKPGED